MLDETRSVTEAVTKIFPRSQLSASCESHNAVSITGQCDPTEDVLRHPSCGSHRTPRWYCAVVKRRSELQAILELKRQNFRTYLPICLPPGSTAPEPMFPGYLFIQFDIAVDRWRPVVSTPGIVRLLGNGELPTPVANAAMDVVRAKCVEGVPLTGQTARPSIVIGDSVLVVGGQHVDLRAVVAWTSERRVGLLMEFFGRTVSVEVAHKNVRTAAR